VTPTGTCESDGTAALREPIRGGAMAPAMARELISRTLGAVAREETMRDLLLLATELVTNAVRHANVDEAGTIDFSAVAADGRVRVAVTDPGGADTPRMQELSVDEPGGMGLFLVDQISQRWAVETGDGGATRVWFELPL
jgi:anti-sigma regulatory factor (Ser/Thr protein kinase)